MQLKTYARCPYGQEEKATGRPPERHFWYEVNTRALKNVPRHWFLRNAESLEKLCEHLNERCSHTPGLTIAKIADGHLWNASRYGVADSNRCVLEYSAPQYNGHTDGTKATVEEFMALVKRHGSLQVPDFVRNEIYQRIKKEGRKYSERAVKTRSLYDPSWDMGRYLNEYGITYNENECIARHNPKAAARRANAMDFPKPKVKKPTEQPALSHRCIVDFARDLLEALMPLGNAYEKKFKASPTLRDPQYGSGPIKGKQSAAMWFIYALRVHGAQFGAYAYRELPSYKKILEGWESNPYKSYESWKGLPEVVAFVQSELSKRKPKIQKPKKLQYAFLDKPEVKPVAPPKGQEKKKRGKEVAVGV